MQTRRSRPTSPTTGNCLALRGNGNLFCLALATGGDSGEAKGQPRKGIGLGDGDGMCVSALTPNCQLCACFPLDSFLALSRARVERNILPSGNKRLQHDSISEGCYTDPLTGRTENEVNGGVQICLKMSFDFSAKTNACTVESL